NRRADAERDVHHEVFLALHRRDGLRAVETQHFAPVKFEEVDRLCGITIRLGPRLTDFVANPRRYFEFAVAHDFCGAEETFSAFLSGDLLPGFERFPGRLDRGV